MKDAALPNYSELDQALSKTKQELHPSEVHGVICGMLSGNMNKETAWDELVTGTKNKAKTRQFLQVLYVASANQLDEFLFEFQLVLPDDSCELSTRAEALTLWCQGYITGLKLAHIPISDREPNETTEAINDLCEIARMNYEEVVASEEDEVAYTELVEYVRMAVTVIYEDNHGSERLH